jgi:hypothetical protein
MSGSGTIDQWFRGEVDAAGPDPPLPTQPTEPPQPTEAIPPLSIERNETEAFVAEPPKVAGWVSKWE